MKTKIIIPIILFFIIFGVVNAWTGPTSAPPGGNTSEPLNVSNSTQTKAGYLYFPKWFDVNDDGYYVDPNSNSWLYRLYSYDVRADIFYDRNNTGYYVDPASTSVLNTVYGSAFLYNSDESLKMNINTIKNATDKISKLRGVNFEWKENEEKDMGFVAQEIEKILPELVKTNSDTSLKSVKYGNITALLVEALKEQMQINEVQEEKINKLEQKINNLINN